MFRTNKNSSLFSSVIPKLTKKRTYMTHRDYRGQRGEESGEGRLKSHLFRMIEATTLSRMQDGLQYFLSNIPALGFREKQKKNNAFPYQKYSAVLHLKSVVWNQKDLAIILSYYNSHHSSAVKLTFWSFPGGQGQTCWEWYPQWTTFWFSFLSPLLLLFRTCCNPGSIPCFWGVSLAYVISSTF